MSARGRKRKLVTQRNKRKYGTWVGREKPRFNAPLPRSLNRLQTNGADTNRITCDTNDLDQILYIVMDYNAVVINFMVQFQPGIIY